MNMERAFKGIWIPAEIWLSKELKIMEKLFLVEIDSLDNEDGCFASNEYFSNFFDLSKNRCSEIIKSLEKKGFIEIEYIYKKNKKSIEKRIEHMEVKAPPKKKERIIININEGTEIATKNLIEIKKLKLLVEDKILVNEINLNIRNGDKKWISKKY